MGSDKAFLELGGGTLLSRALELARSVDRAGTAAPGSAIERSSTKNEFVTIVGDRSKFAAFGPVVQDVYPDRGPLAAIHAALLSSNSDLNLMLAVDLPFVNAQLLNYLLSRAEESGAVVTVPFVEKRYQPLCAVYRREFTVSAETALKQNKNKIDALFSEVRTCIIDEQELTAAGFRTKAFRNVNTPEDWEQAKREIESPVQHLS